MRKCSSFLNLRDGKAKYSTKRILVEYKRTRDNREKLAKRVSPGLEIVQPRVIGNNMSMINDIHTHSPTLMMGLNGNFITRLDYYLIVEY